MNLHCLPLLSARCTGSDFKRGIQLRFIPWEVRPVREAFQVRGGRGAQGHRAPDLQLRAAAHAVLPRELDGLLRHFLLDVRSGSTRRVPEARGYPRSVRPERSRKSMRKTCFPVVSDLKLNRSRISWIESPHCARRSTLTCAVPLALRTAMDIGNGNIASVRLAFISTRIGTPGSKNM